MKVYKLEVMIIDFDGIGPDEMQITIEGTNYPNDCISPRVMNFDIKDIGEWEDSNPLNNVITMKDEFERLFNT